MSLSTSRQPPDFFYGARLSAKMNNGVPDISWPKSDAVKSWQTRLSDKWGNGTALVW
jgi:hypothetical protein